jgi:hypothetical protein
MADREYLSAGDRKIGNIFGTKPRETGSNQCDRAHQVGFLTPLGLHFWD